MSAPRITDIPAIPDYCAVCGKPYSSYGLSPTLGWYKKYACGAVCDEEQRWFTPCMERPDAKGVEIPAE